MSSFRQASPTFRPISRSCVRSWVLAPPDALMAARIAVCAAVSRVKAVRSVGFLHAASAPFAVRWLHPISILRSWPPTRKSAPCATSYSVFGRSLT